MSASSVGRSVPKPGRPQCPARLGGRLDVAPSASWASFEGEPMAFVAPVNLADVRPLDESGLLPPEGLP